MASNKTSVDIKEVIYKQHLFRCILQYICIYFSVITNITIGSSTIITIWPTVTDSKMENRKEEKRKEGKGKQSKARQDKAREKDSIICWCSPLNVLHAKSDVQEHSAWVLLIYIASNYCLFMGHRRNWMIYNNIRAVFLLKIFPVKCCLLMKKPPSFNAYKESLQKLLSYP